MLLINGDTSLIEYLLHEFLFLSEDDSSVFNFLWESLGGERIFCKCFISLIVASTNVYNDDILSSRYVNWLLYAFVEDVILI